MPARKKFAAADAVFETDDDLGEAGFDNPLREAGASAAETAEQTQTAGNYANATPASTPPQCVARAGVELWDLARAHMRRSGVLSTAQTRLHERLKLLLGVDHDDSGQPRQIRALLSALHGYDHHGSWFMVRRALSCN